MGFDLIVIAGPLAAVLIFVGALWYWLIYKPKSEKMLETVLTAPKDKKPLWMFMGKKGISWHSYVADAPTDYNGASAVHLTNGLILGRVTDDDIKLIGGKMNFALADGGIVACRIDSNQKTCEWDMTKLDKTMSDITKAQMKEEASQNLISHIEFANKMKQKDYAFQEEFDRKKKRRQIMDEVN